MARDRLQRQANFSGGEIAPLAMGEVSARAYATGLRIALNFLPTLEGPLLNRPGDRFVHQTLDQFRGGVAANPIASRLIPFKFTDGQNFILEFGDAFIRFVQNGVMIQAPAGVIPAWSAITPYVAAGFQVSFGGLGWESLQASLNQQPPATAGASNAFWRPLPYEIDSPWGIGFVDRLDYSQDGDIVTITHPSFDPREVTRLSNTNWTLTAVDFSDQQYFAGVPFVPNDINQRGELAPAYNNGTTYNIGDHVLFDIVPGLPANGGYLYVSKVLQTGASPQASPSTWTNLSLIPSFGIGEAASTSEDWDAGVTYNKGDFVLRISFQAYNLYESVIDGNVGNDPTTTTPGAWYDATWSLYKTYKKGAYVWQGSNQFDGQIFISLADHNFDGQGNTSPHAPSTNWAPATDTGRPAIRVQWVITQFWQDSLGERRETLASRPTKEVTAAILSDRPATIAWGDETLGSGAPASYVLLGYGVYRGNNGIFGLVGTTPPTVRTFTDAGLTPNFGIQPPKGTNPFDFATGPNTKTQSWPGVVTNHEQRRVFARTDKKPQDTFGSAVNEPTTFDINTPIEDSDTYDWKVASEDLEEIRHLLSLRYLLYLTSGGVFGGYGPAGAISATGINLRRYSKDGASYLKPVIVENGAVYQTVKNRLRDLVWNWQVDGYVGRDLSLPGRHLFDGGLSIVDMAYADSPFSLIYAVRSDGVLLTLTYSPGGVSGWARHTTQGSFERVAVIEEADPVTGVIEDAVYVVVKRTVNGQVVRYIERFSSRLLPTILADVWDEDYGLVTKPIDDLRRGNFLDCSIEYDGRNTADNSDTEFPLATLIGLTAGQQAPMTGMVADFFGAADIGKIIVFDPDAQLNGPYLFRIVGIAEPVPVVEAQGSYTTLAADYPSGSTSNWALAIAQVAGLDHLEGLSVSVLADGGVQGPFTVQGGQVTLTEPAVIAQIGLAYVSDMMTLDIAAEAVRTNQKTVKAVSLDIVASRDFMVGQDFRPGSLVPQSTVPVIAEVEANEAPVPQTRLIQTNIPSGFTPGGRIAVRQIDPLPLAIIAVLRDVLVEGR